jgi:hypothetical protein
MTDPGDKPKSKASTRLGMKSPVTPNSYAGKAMGQGLAVDGNGRPTNLTPELQETIIADMLLHGDWPSMTAYRCGVSPDTVSNWLVRGADPYAVEPYRGFVAAFVAAEASIHGELLKVIVDDALGRGTPPAQGQRAKSAAWAAWLLQHRWGYLWRLNKDTGRSNGTTVAEVVDQTLARFSEDRRDKAKAIIAQLSQEARASARKEGFLL